MSNQTISIDVDALTSTPIYKPDFIIEAGANLSFEMFSAETPTVIISVHADFADGGTYLNYADLLGKGDFNDSVSTTTRFGSPLKTFSHSFKNGTGHVKSCNMYIIFTYADMTTKIFNLPVRVLDTVSSDKISTLKVLEAKSSDISDDAFVLLETKNGGVIPAVVKKA